MCRRSLRSSLVGDLPFKDCETGEFSSDRLGRFASDTLEALDFIGHSLELIEGCDVLSLQRLPSVERQLETRKRPLASVIKTLRHLLTS
jgi:hypothetical protein